jgi:hypothetical protein
MEYGINLIAKPTDKYSESINKLIKSFISGDKDNAMTALDEIEVVAVEKYTEISTHEYYADYLSYLENLNPKKIDDEYNLDITTGGLGYEFAVALVDLLGPYCEKLTAYVTHDEDDGHIPIKVNYHNDAVYADGEEVSVRTFEVEEIDLWAVDPLLDSRILEPIHNICKKAKTSDDFTPLSKIYIDLFKPIVAIAESYDLCSDLLSIDDEAEYKSYINDVLDLEIHKNNHPVINFFKNKMHENLENMVSSNYLGSIFDEYKKTLLVFYTIYDLHNNKDCEESFDEFFEEVVDQEEFEVIYEITALLEFGAV